VVTVEKESVVLKNFHARPSGYYLKLLFNSSSFRSTGIDKET